MIESIEVKGFKTLQDVVIPLAEGITVLVGANNSGKSNILLLLSLVAATVRTGSFAKAAALFGGIDSLVTRGAKRDLSITVRFRDGESTAAYQLGFPDQEIVSYSVPGGGELKVSRDDNGVFISPEGGGVRAAVGSGLFHWVMQPGVPVSVVALHRALINLEVRDLSVSAIREASLALGGAKLERDGRNLAAVLDDLNPDMLEAVERNVKEAAPEIRRVLVRNAIEPGKRVVGVQEAGGGIFTANEMSDGLLLFIGLSVATALAGDASSVLGIEEPERGVHPRRIRDLVDLMRLVVKAGSQVVVTTHSPELLNEFRDQPESVVILDRDASGTRVTRLSDRQDWISDMEGKPLGEIWYSGILGGVPSRSAPIQWGGAGQK